MRIRRSTLLRPYISPAIATALTLAVCMLPVSSEVRAQSGAADSTETIDYNDGPHVFWQNDSTAIVFYWCESALDTQRFVVTDTLRFAGRCKDTGLVYTVPRTSLVPNPSIYDGVSRIFAVSDIHGEYEYLVDILMQAGVTDAAGHWSWGDGHLVIDGDIFDRGDKVTECLWLVYRLEKEARRAGGRVHYLLGNHDWMPLRGDYRYVNEKYTDGIARKTRIRYEHLFGADMELGRWLQSRNTAIRINGILFVHGGAAPVLADRGLDLDALNDAVRASINLPSSQVAFSDLPKLLFGSVGPFWYRGFFEESEGRYPLATDEDIDRVLAFYEADVVVVGHTGFDHVSTQRGGRVITIDVPYEDLYSLEGLLWEDGQFYRVTGTGERVVLQ